MYRRPPSSEKIGRDLPIFSEGEGTSVHRLQVSALHFWSKTKDIKNKRYVKANSFSRKFIREFC